MTLFSSLPGAVRALWAKSGELTGHGLLAHMLDVAAVAETILSREPASSLTWISQQLGLAPAAAPRWLAALVGLHDFGKAIPGFQAKWDRGHQLDADVGLPFTPAGLQVTEHDRASAALLRDTLSDKIPHAAWVTAISQAVSAHHGYNFNGAEIRSGKPPRSEGDAWRSTREALFAAYWDTLAPAGMPERSSLELPAVQWLAGLTSIADWIGSNPEWLPPEERDASLIGHYEGALSLARNALDEIGWAASHPLLVEDTDTDQLVGRILQSNGRVEARPLQAEADQLLRKANGPTLMIVEAPMGEGKTELAFLAHLRLQATNGHRGLYVALPTQATGNAMFDRTLQFLQAFAHETRLDIQLAHGGAMLDERIHRLRHIYGERGDTIGSSAWFSQRRRALLSCYGVGTVDQALFATLNVKHHFVRLWGLANRVVVLDEVHAYDTYTNGLITALLRWLKALNCSVVLMSATLPEKRRAALLEAWGATADATAAIPYPRVLMTRGEMVAGASFASRPLAPINVTGIPEALDALADHAETQLLHGGCGVIVVNTVDRAQRLYNMLRTRLGTDVDLMLFHARYPADERGRRERAVMRCFGRTGKRPARALLIATQVVEQSLDIDFDFMCSDLAPVDLLLQRAGRLHRHERNRPAAHQHARLAVAGLVADRLPELKETAWGFVYAPYVLYRTWATALCEPVWRLPEDIDRLVQAVYGDAALPGSLSAEDRARIEVEAYGALLADEQQEALFARNAAIDAAAEPQQAYTQKPRGNEEGDGFGLRNRTRLGDDGVTVVPIHVGNDGWRLHPEEVAFNPVNTPDDALARAIFARQVKLSRKNVVVALAGTEVPAGFAEHPLLRNLVPLLLTDGAATLGKGIVRLDAELGITYGNQSPDFYRENQG